MAIEEGLRERIIAPEAGSRIIRSHAGHRHDTFDGRIAE